MGTHPIFESDFDCLTVKKMRILRFIRGGQPGKQVGISKTRQIALPATVLTIGITGTISLAENNRECKKLARQLDRASLIGQCKVVTECFVGSAIGIYAAQHFNVLNMLESWAVLATRNYISPWTSWFTSTLIHGGILHLLFNMMALTSFERGFNTLHLIETFSLGAVWSGAAAALFATSRMSRSRMTIGASGAIIGLFGANAVRAYENPQFNQSARIQLIPPLNLIHKSVGVDSFTMLEATSLFVAISFLLLFRQVQTGRGVVSHVGHLGGFAGGAMAEMNRRFRQ